MLRTRTQAVCRDGETMSSIVTRLEDAALQVAAWGQHPKEAGRGVTNWVQPHTTDTVPTSDHDTCPPITGRDD